MPSNTKFNQANDGTAPFQVTSTTVVANLKSETSNLAANSTLFNSQADTVFAKLADNETISGDYTFSGDSTFSGGVDFETTGASSIPEFNGNGNTSANPPFSLGTEAITATTVVTGLNSDRLDGYHSASFGKLGSADEVTADWEFSGQPDFTNGTVPFSVTSTAVVNNLKSDTCVLADNSTLLGGVAASTYPRTNNNETLTSIWQFGNASNAVPIKMAEMSTPSEPATSFGYLYHNSADNGIYWMTHNTEGDHDTNLMATDASALYSGTATSSQNTDVEFLSITPTTPDQTYMVEIRVVGRGTAGDFDNGYVAFRAYNMFYTSTLGVFTADYITGASRTPGKARDGAGTIMDVNVSGGAEFIIPILIDASGNIQVKAHGYTDLGSPNSFSWKYWIKVYQV